MFSLILCIGCKSDDKTQPNNIEKPLLEKQTKAYKKDIFQNSFKIDTSLIKKNHFGSLKISDSVKEDSILALCQCQKFQKHNRIIIQVQTAIPTQKELDTMSETFKKRNRFLQFSDLGNPKTIHGQFKFITLVLKDSSVESINLYSKSTDKEYNGTNFDSLSIETYKINISKFDYAIASNIFGNFELHLNKDFGFFENDTILKGGFLCNNWVISDKKQIKNWDIKKSFEVQNNLNYIE